MRENDIALGGWLALGGTYSTDNPDHHNNAPITFNDRSGEFQLNQFNLFLERLVDQESQQWNFGGRLDVMFGTDSRFTQATVKMILGFMTLPFRKRIWKFSCLLATA